MTAWWQAFYNQFTPEECNEIIRYGLTHKAIEGTIGHGGTKSVIDREFRQSNVRWFKRDDQKLQWLYDRLHHLMLKANANAFGFDIAGFTDVQFTEYDGAKQGHYDWHEDNAWKGTTMYDRKLSLCVQLSPTDSYKGGRLELHNDPIGDNVFRNQGDVIVFPSHNRHRVTDVTEGTRYSLVTWFIGPRLR